MTYCKNNQTHSSFCTINSYQTLFDRFEHWLTNSTKLAYVLLTRDGYLRIIHAFLNYLNAYAVPRLNDVTLDLLNTFIQFKPDHTPYKANSILVRQAALSIFFSWAFQQRLCQENVFLRYRKSHVKLKPYDLSEPIGISSDLVVLTEEEQQQVLKVLGAAATFIEKRTAAIISLILAAGLHREEICQLRLQQVNWAKGTLTIEASTRKREVKIDKPFCEKALKNWLQSRQEALQGKACDWVFFTERLTAIRVNKLPLYIKPMLETAGIPSEKATADCLRQTAIYRWIAQGISLEKIQAQFGFKQIASLKRYLS